jgi:hypothetical protein
MAVLAFRFDESYNHRTMMVGGWLARANQWKRLESRIQKSLAFENKTLEKKVTRYHAAEMNGNYGEYAGWESEATRKLRMTKKLFKAVSNGQMFGISCGVDIDSYKKVYSDAPNSDPYVLCITTVMVFIAEACDTFLQPEDRVLLMHDHGSWDAQALEGYNIMVDDVNWKSRHRFVGILPMTWKEDVCMQAADMIAYESFKKADSLIFSNGNTRKALEALLNQNKGMHGRYFDLESLKALKAIDDEKAITV